MAAAGVSGMGRHDDGSLSVGRAVNQVCLSEEMRLTVVKRLAFRPHSLRSRTGSSSRKWNFRIGLKMLERRESLAGW